jgi:molybdopterin-biosynthesis enzyme MoeA-like protein
VGFGAYIIGDEIISGKRVDKHFAKVIEILAARGLDLDWCQYLRDDRARLIAAFRCTLATSDVVFSFGGIGVTPDDHTRQAAAEAMGVELILHPEAEQCIRERFGGETTPQRLILGEFPVGAQIVPNPYNRIPGFSVREHYFLPGFPEMAWPMMEWVLDTRYRALHHAVARVECALRVFDAYESALLDLMQEVSARCGRATLFSLPTLAVAGGRRHLELGMRGDPVEVENAMAMLRAGLTARGYAFEEIG